MINKLENSLLITTALGLCVIGFGFGFEPNYYPKLFGYNLENINAFHIFKAFNGLYIAFSVFWIYSIVSSELKKSAILSIIILMCGLIAGRIWSILIEGIPHWLLLAFLGLEIFVLAQAVFVYMNKYKLEK